VALGPVADLLPAEISLEGRQGAGADAPERAALTIGELNPRRETCRQRIAEEGIAELNVHDQLPERLFHGLPTHRRPPL